MQGLTDALHRALGSDDAEAMQALITEMEVQTAALANAVVANTLDDDALVEPAAAVEQVFSPDTAA